MCGKASAQNFTVIGQFNTIGEDPANEWMLLDYRNYTACRIDEPISTNFHNLVSTLFLLTEYSVDAVVGPALVPAAAVAPGPADADTDADAARDPHEFAEVVVRRPLGPRRRSLPSLAWSKSCAAAEDAGDAGHARRALLGADPVLELLAICMIKVLGNFFD